MFVVVLVAMYCVAVLAAPHFLKKQSYGNFIVDHSTNMATVDVVAIPLLSCETIELTSFVDLASALLAFGAIAACAFVVAKGCEDRTLRPSRLKQRYHTVSRLSMHGQDSFFLVLSFFVCFRKTD